MIAIFYYYDFTTTVLLIATNPTPLLHAALRRTKYLYNYMISSKKPRFCASPKGRPRACDLLFFCIIQFMRKKTQPLRFLRTGSAHIYYRGPVPPRRYLGAYHHQCTPFRRLCIQHPPEKTDAFSFRHFPIVILTLESLFNY